MKQRNSIISPIIYTLLPVLLSSLGTQFGPLHLFNLYFINLIGSNRQNKPVTIKKLLQKLYYDLQTLAIFVLCAAVILVSLNSVCSLAGITLGNLLLIGSNSQVLFSLSVYGGIFGLTSLLSYFGKSGDFNSFPFSSMFFSVLYNKLKNGAQLILAVNPMGSLALYIVSLVPLAVMLISNLINTSGNNSKHINLISTIQFSLHLYQTLFMILGLSFGSKTLIKITSLIWNHPVKEALLLITMGSAIQEGVVQKPIPPVSNIKNRADENNSKKIESPKKTIKTG